MDVQSKIPQQPANDQSQVSKFAIFLTTLPGMITAMATLIGAIGGAFWGGTQVRNDTVSEVVVTKIVPGPTVTVTVIPTTSADQGNSGVTPSTPPSSTSTGAVGTVINQYTNYNLPSGLGINFTTGPRPQPQNNSYCYFAVSDLCYSQVDGYYTSGQFALINAPQATYQDCKNDTILSSRLQNVISGQTICFLGHGVVATASIENYASQGGVDYVTMNVTVWRD